MSSGGHAPPWTARCPWPPCQGEGPRSLCLGLPGRGAHCLLPLSTPLPLAPPPHQAFLTPPPLPFWGTGKCHIITATNDTKALVLSASRLALGLTPAAAPKPICHPEARLLPAAMPLLGTHLCPVLPRPFPLHPVPPCPRQTRRLLLAITSACGPGCSRTSPWQCLHEMMTIHVMWFAPSIHLSLPSTEVCWEGTAA